MGNEWDDYAGGWDDDPAARAYATAAHRSLIAALSAHRLRLDGLQVLDFGCGTGLLTERLARDCGSVHAVDTSEAMLGVLNDKIDRNGWPHVCTGRSLPTDVGGHDLIVCSSVCSFLDDYPATVAQLVRLLRPGGLFVQWDWEREGEADDSDGLTRSEISSALTAAGLEAVEVRVGFELPMGEHTMRPLMGTGRRGTEPPEEGTSDPGDGTQPDGFVLR
ncbi:MAG: class I SAM-dependent methyltransferase [Microthrixaceae bacterium]